MTAPIARETPATLVNPAGIEGIEFVEYRTPRPQALGQVLEAVGFRPIARHRSREVLLYRQGGMNVIVNAHGVAAAAEGDVPQIAALALRVRDAAAAWKRAVDLGGWPVPVQVQPMELHIPGIQGPGASRLYFVDRWREFSIYDVDFVPIPTVDPVVPAVQALHWFGVVQYVGLDRSADWSAFYSALLGFAELPAEQRFGILPSGRVLASPCGTFYFQLVEPQTIDADDAHERLHRVAFGSADVPAATAALRERGVDFVESETLRSNTNGALTRPQLGGVMFELVHHRQE